LDSIVFLHLLIFQFPFPSVETRDIDIFFIPSVKIIPSNVPSGIKDSWKRSRCMGTTDLLWKVL
jgi:hypothetical protein